MYAIVVLVEDLLNDNEVFGTGTPIENVKPRVIVEEDHDSEDRVPISLSLGKSPWKSVKKGTREALQQVDKRGREEASGDKADHEGKKKK